MKAYEKHTTGISGEELAVKYIQKQGFSVLERNFKKFYGEIDIIAKQGNTVVFIEVKTRRKSYFALSQLITPSKQHKIIKTAENYIARNHLYNYILRFDVALVEGVPSQETITYIPHAFSKPEFL